MKLFIREHLLLIMVQCVQFGLIASIYWLAGFRDLQLVLYSVFLGIVLLCLYLLYHYISRRAYYRRLSGTVHSLEEMLEKEGNAPVYLALQQLLKSNYQLYQNDLLQTKDRQEEQLVFMDLWVHQMKTPISVIELMARDLDEPYSTSIRDENEKLKTGLNTVLHMSRLRLIDQDFHVKQLHLKQIVNDVNQEEKRLFIRSNVYPKVEATADVVIESDEKWLFFMISQLVHNAVKYSEEKSNQLLYRIYVKADQPVLEIVDFGIGIPASDVKRVFDAFYTGENGREYKESTGVGLYVTKEVAAYLGHDLEVESVVGEGTTLRIGF